MQNEPLKSCVLIAALIGASSIFGQEMPPLGFESVGRGRPLTASVHDYPDVGPVWIVQPGQPGREVERTLDGFRPGRLPRGYDPLPRDLFTSDDFYADEELWSDPRYFRCNSVAGTERQRGVVSLPPLIPEGASEAAAPWGHCEYDYPRDAILSPYGFATAQQHYEALLDETRKRGGPNAYTFKDFPAAEWNGVYERPGGTAARNHPSWYHGWYNQMSTLVSLLTPPYQQRMVQEAYHHVRGHAAWPSTFCWPEGFMRRYNYASVTEHHIVATPDLVQVLAGVARNFITNIYVGREFDMEDVPNGGVPRLGAAVPRWYGETIGFWDGDALITWTSNIQAWKSHGAFDFSSKMQSIEIYTPNRDEAGTFVGLNHETILYDPEALVEPVRIVRNLRKLNDFTDDDATPYPFIECVQTIFSINGRNTPVAPGAVIDYEVPDMYGRPWATILERHFEQGMTKPDAEDDLFSFD
jgi:hypothetical protein